MLKIRNELVNDVVAKSIEWPDSRAIYAFVNALEERDRELAYALEETINAYVGRVADAAWTAGFTAGRHPERLIFAEG